MSTGKQFFEIRSPRDMLNKAMREYARLQADRNTDNVFNFFVTATHITDYARDFGIPESEIPQGVDFQLCRDLCNMGKHLGDSKRKYRDNKFDIESVKLWDEGLWDEGLWDGKEPTFEFDSNRLDVLKLAEKIITAWDAVLTKHGQ